ncbi:MAG TPA: ChbG/HpnK family deacetylase [Terriglobales bacterium]|nr:ChbG/HpnK family deacetylase [Terriglobales bacterium]
MRRLIVNADDFGLTAGVNRGIVEAHAAGIVTSTTLMANSAAFDDAVQLARSNPKLSVGCHLVLIDGSPLLAADNVPSLMDPNHRSHFRQNLSGFALRALSGRLDPDEIEAEATAQIRKLQSAGIRVSHIDTHKHTHMFPQILRPLLRAAQACDVRAVRNPFGRVVFSLVASHPGLWKRYGQVRLLNVWQGNFRQAVADSGMITTDGSLGVVATGALDDRLIQFILETLPEGTWELVTHPGYNDADLQGVATRLRESRQLELKALTSASARQLLGHKGIQLISYRDLA